MDIYSNRNAREVLAIDLIEGAIKYYKKNGLKIDGEKVADPREMSEHFIELFDEALEVGLEDVLESLEGE
jgi:hypothetical protein